MTTLTKDDSNLQSPVVRLNKTERENALTAKVDALVDGMANADPTGIAEFGWCPACEMVFTVAIGSDLPTHDICRVEPGEQIVALTHCSKCSRSYLADAVHICAGMYQEAVNLPDHGPKPLLADDESAQPLLQAALHALDCRPFICTCEDSAAQVIAHLRGLKA